MKKGIVTGVIVAAVLCAVIVPKVMTKKTFAEPVADPVVEVADPRTGDIKLTSGLVGSVEPEEVVYVYPKAGGDVTEVKIKAGQTVNAGDLICVIDTK